MLALPVGLWVLPGATTSQMRRGEYKKNGRNSSWVPISQVDGRKGHFVRRGVLRVQCEVSLQHKPQGPGRDPGNRYVLCSRDA